MQTDGKVSLSSRVRIGDDVVFRDLEGEAVILNLDTGVYFGLDSVGTRIWHLLVEHGDLEKVLATLLGEYEVGSEECSRDLLHLVSQLQSNGLVEVIHEEAP